MTNFSSINFDNVDADDKNFDNGPLPAGDYLVQVVRVTDNGEQTSKKGDLYQSLSIGYQVLDGEHQNRWIFDNRVCYAGDNEAHVNIGLSTIKRIALYSGLTGDDGKVKIADALELVGGRAIGIRVKHNEYDGRTYANVVKIFPADDLKPSSAPEAPNTNEGGDDSLAW